MVLVRRPRMQHMRVSQELDIADLQNHMQRVLQTRVLQHLQRLELRRRQRGDDSRIGEAGERADIVRIPPGPQQPSVKKTLVHTAQCKKRGPILGIHTRVLAALKIHHTRPDVLILTLGGLALAIKIPDWLR